MLFFSEKIRKGTPEKLNFSRSLFRDSFIRLFNIVRIIAKNANEERVRQLCNIILFLTA